MTSRVQKGGAVFRPVAKARPRQSANVIPRLGSSASVEPSPLESASIFNNPSLDLSDSAPNRALDPSPEVRQPSELPEGSLEPTSQQTQATPIPFPPLSSFESVSTRPREKPIELRPPESRIVSRSSSAAPQTSRRGTAVPEHPRQSSDNEQRSQLISKDKTDPDQSGIDTSPSPGISVLRESIIFNTPPPITVTIEHREEESPIQAQNLDERPSVSPSANRVVESISNARRRGRKKASDTDEPPAKRRRKSTETTNADDSYSESSKSKATHSRKRSSSANRSRTPRASSQTPIYSQEEDPGEPIDPTAMTMADLCSDTGQGRVSNKVAEIQSNFSAWKARSREKRAQMRSAAERKKYGQEDPDEMDGQPSSAVAHPTASTSQPLDETSGAVPNPESVGASNDTDEFDYTQNMSGNKYSVQIRIGPNGETIIDEESLVVDRAENVDTSSYTHVVESDHTKFTNSLSYSKKSRGSRWSAEETELFFNALSQYGENFELIACIMPGRDRKACKNKFKAEDKKDPTRINHCLNNSIPVDIPTLARMTGKDFSGPTPEIKIPERPIVKEQPLSEPESDAPSHSTTSKKSRKRSRSVTAPVPEDEGVQIIGSADSFAD